MGLVWINHDESSPEAERGFVEIPPCQGSGFAGNGTLASLHRESGLVAWGARHVWWWWVKGILRILERVEVEGRGICRPSRRLCWWRITPATWTRRCWPALVGTVANRIFPIAAGDTFFKTPALAAFAAGFMNALPMWRKNCGRHAIEDLRQRLIEEPCALHLVPRKARAPAPEKWGRSSTGWGCWWRAPACRWFPVISMARSKRCRRVGVGRGRGVFG